MAVREMKSCENYDPCFPDQPVVDRYLPIWAALPAFRSKPAFIWAEYGAHGNASPSAPTLSCATYAELDSAVDAMASRLLSRHPLRRGDTVLVLCSPGLTLVTTIFACQRSGLVSVPLIPPDAAGKCRGVDKRQLDQLLRALSQTKPKAAIAHRDYLPQLLRSISSFSSLSNGRLRSLLQKLHWIPIDYVEDTTARSIDGAGKHYSGCNPGDVFLVQYTSGATGIPKPVMVTAGAAAHNVRVARKAYDLCPSSVVVSWLPQYHDCGLMFLLLTVVCGATCVLTSPVAFVRRPRRWLELVSAFKGTCTPVPSFALPLVARRGRSSGGRDCAALLQPLMLGCLRNLVLINEPIYRDSVEEFLEEFRHCGLNPSCVSPSYGLAENCTFVSTAWSADNHRFFPDLPTYKKLLPCARLGCRSSADDKEVDILVVNEDTSEPVEDGVEGEIWVSSPSNAWGYLGHPSLTREVFHGRIRGRAAGRFVRTGDRGVVITTKERYLFVMGRSADVIKPGGGEQRHPVHSHYLETAAYRSCAGSLRGGCIAAFEVPTASRAIAVIAELQRVARTEPHETYRGTCEAIRESILREEGVGVGWVVLVASGSVPKTTSGKVQRHAAMAKLLGGGFPVIYDVQFCGGCGQPAMLRSQGGKSRGEGDAEGEGHKEISTANGRPRSRTIISLL